jgi:DNA-binding transcriptional ArsR family regulator
MTESNLESLMQFFKALANENRLKMLGVLAGKECGVEELATILNLKAPTISHHLGILKNLGVVGMRVEGNDHLYRLDSEGLEGATKRVFASFTSDKVTDLVEGVEFDAWEKKVINNFVKGAQILEIPAGYKKRLVILKWLVDFFEDGRKYTEKEVNEVLSQHHQDFSTLRRELIGNKLMERERGVYWRLVWSMPDLGN